jgi:hypothetical protein
MNPTLFQTEQEYNAFRVWAQEGSTIGQRMTAVEGGKVKEIPKYWHQFKPYVDNMPATFAEWDRRLDTPRA